MVKHLPTMQETQVQSLGWADPLEKEMATHSSTLAWKIPWLEEPRGLQSKGLQRVGHACATKHTRMGSSSGQKDSFLWDLEAFPYSEALESDHSLRS